MTGRQFPPIPHETSRSQNGKGKCILDAGCGPGHHSAYFANEGNSVTGIDLAHNFINLANSENHADCHFIHSDMRSLNQIYKNKNQFDAIWSCGSCIHLSREAIDRQVRDFIAFLKPGGIMGLSLQIDAPSLVQKDGRFFERYQEAEVFKMLDRHGLKILSVYIDINDKSTTSDKLKLKKWFNVVVSTPRHKTNLPFE